MGSAQKAEDPRTEDLRAEQLRTEDVKQPAGNQHQIVSPEFGNIPNDPVKTVPTVDNAQQTEGKSSASLQSRARAFNGWILPVTINGVVTGALIDSGASTSV